MLRFDDLAVVRIGFDLTLREPGRRKYVGRVEHRLPPQGPDAGPVEHAILLLDLLGLAPPGAGSHQLAAGPGIGGVDVAGGLSQTPLVVGRDVREESPVRDDRLEQLGCGTDLFEEGGLVSLVRSPDIGLWHGAKSNRRLPLRHEPRALIPSPRSEPTTRWYPTSRRVRLERSEEGPPP